LFPACLAGDLAGLVFGETFVGRVDFPQFCRRYGLDIREWPGYAWLRDLRELRMITTNARKSAPGSTTAAEVLRRIEALRADVPTTWHIL